MYDGEAEKLKHKNALEQLRWDLENRFEFSEILVDALMRRFQLFIEENDVVDEQGRLTYWATAADQPPGRTQGEMRKVQVRLTLCHPEDIDILQQGGTKAVRKRRIMRMASEAKEQGALLTQEDMALLLCNAPRAIRYDIQEIREEGIEVPTRGYMTDIGRGVSHKVRIVEHYLKGFSYPEIERRTQHSQESIDRYVRDFSRVAYLLERDEPVERIRQVTGLSESLVREYQRIHEDLPEEDFPRLREVLAEVRKKSLERKERGGSLD